MQDARVCLDRFFALVPVVDGEFYDRRVWEFGYAAEAAIDSIKLLFYLVTCDVYGYTVKITFSRL